MTEHKANLGLATTRELLDEIRARIEVDYIVGQPGGLGYSTVEGWKPYRAKEVNSETINNVGQDNQLHTA